MDLVTTTNRPVSWNPPSRVSKPRIVTTVNAFLDTASTSFGRATHYNTREEQQAAEIASHKAMFDLDRDLYTLLLMLPGVTDRSKQVGTKNLLGSPRTIQTSNLLTPQLEREALYRMIGELPPPRMFKLFDAFRYGSVEEGIPKANNARTRKLVLRTILSSPRLELWAVKYRTKMQRALTHAWGRRNASVIRSILAKDSRTLAGHERMFIRKQLDRYAGEGDLASVNKARAGVRFAFGIPDDSLPLFREFYAAKQNLAVGKKLPPEVLEGIRSTYHKTVPKEKILDLTKDNLTKGQKLAVQKRAKAAGVEVKMNPVDYDPVRLYIYAYENGITPSIAKALLEKAEKAAKAFPLSFASVGILVDASASMFGDDTQKLRPMAATLAMRDMLQFTAPNHAVIYCGGELQGPDELLVRPCGDTSLANGLARLIETECDAIFVLSDGYENAPAGRFAETVKAARKFGVTAPIYHINPVFAAEVAGVRELAEGVPTMPVKDPKAMGLSMLRGYLEADPVAGVNMLVGLTLPQLSGGA